MSTSGAGARFVVSQVEDEIFVDALSSISSKDTSRPKSNENYSGPIRTHPFPDDYADTNVETLNQTSITRLLARTIKTYRTCRKQTERSVSSVPSTKKKHEPKKKIASKYESLDYDQCENLLFRKEFVQQTIWQARLRWVGRWFVCFLIGASVAAIAALIDIVVTFGAHLKFISIEKLCTTDTCFVLPLFVWILFNAVAAIVSSSLATCVEPCAAGSGIPQLKCYLNGVHMPGLLTLRTLCTKAVSVTFAILSGVVCGKEGPMIHCGAIIAAGISQGRSRLLRRDFKILEYLRTDVDKRDFVACGTAAGVSASFGAPLGGVLFSLEEAASFWNQSLTWHIIFTSLVATFTLNVILSAMQGHPGDLSNPGLVSFGTFENATYHAVEFPFFVIMGVIGGLIGALFNLLNYQLASFRKQYLYARPCCRVIEAVLVASGCAVLSTLLILSLTSQCAAEDDLLSERHVELNCANGQKNVMSHVFFNTPEGTLIGLLHDGPSVYSVVSLLILAGFYFVMSCWTYGLGIASGAFASSLLIGACWGRLYGIGMVTLFPFIGQANMSKYAVIGATCQLGGIIRMTISITVILIECTGDITFGLPILIVLIVAKWVGDLFTRGLYDLSIQLMGIPMLPWEPPEMSYHILASEVMNSNVVTMQPVESVANVMHILNTKSHSGFPIVATSPPSSADNASPTTFGRCKGLILRSQLIILLKCKCFQSTADNAIASTLSSETFRNAHSRFHSIADLELTDVEKALFIDLQPYLNPVPYTAPLIATLPRLFRLFRGLGLRHLIIVNDSNEVVGMVTRKDLARFRLKDRGMTLRVQELKIQPE